jgi:Tfp pilus assembly protein PilN
MRNSINLIAEILEGERFPTEKLILPAALFLPLLSLLLASAWEAVSARALGHQLQQIASQRDALTKEVTRLTGEITNFQHQQTTERQEAERKLTAVKGLLKDRILWSEVFREVSFIVPPGVWLTSIEAAEPGSVVAGGASSGARLLQATEGKQVKFSGFAKSNAAVTQFIAALERSEHFTEISLVYSQRNPEPGSQQVNFEIAANLRTARL